MTFFEYYLKFSGFNIKKSIEKIKYLRSLDDIQFSKWQNNRKSFILNYHFENNNFYRNHLKGIFPSSWDKIPILEKKNYQLNLESMLSKKYTLKDVYISNTSGSSGHPFTFAKDKESHAMTWAYIKLRYEELNLEFSDLEARFYGIPKDYKSYYREKIKDFIMRRKRFPVFDLSDKALYNFLKIFKKYKFKYVYGYTNSILIFSKYLIKNNVTFFELCPTVKKIIVTAEMCFPENRKIIENAFKLPVYNEYGSSETGYIAYEETIDNWVVSSENIFLENDSDSNLLVTDLNNKAFPIIKYKIGDIALVKNKKGRQYLTGLNGRTNDNIILPSGKKSPGLTFYYISKFLLEELNIIKEFIIRQTSFNKFIFEIISKRNFNKQDLQVIQSHLDNYLEKGLKFEIKYVSKIKRPKSGKIKHFYSEL